MEIIKSYQITKDNLKQLKRINDDIFGAYAFGVSSPVDPTVYGLEASFDAATHVVLTKMEDSELVVKIDDLVVEFGEWINIYPDKHIEITKEPL